MSTTTNNELATVNEDAGYLALRDFDLGAMLSDELAGLNLTFERIKIPSGGGLVFEIPGDDPANPDTVKDFEAVILYNHPMNAFYRDEYKGGNNPPDCGSFDGIYGTGDPGGRCDKCPYNEFGSGKQGAGKACKNRRRMFLLREGELFPVILSLPTGSLKDYTKYVTRLMAKGLKPSGVVTKFSLKRANSSTNIVFSQAQFALARKLTPEEAQLVASYASQIKALSQNVGYEEEAAEGTAEENPFANVDPETGEILEPLK